MTIVIKGPLTTENVEKAIKQFEKDASIKSIKKKFWPFNINTGKVIYPGAGENNVV